MIRLLRLVHFAYWRRHPMQALVPVLGIAAGVAAVVAVDLGSNSTVSSFRRTMQQLEGRATHQLLPQGVELDGRLAWDLQKLAFVRAAAPVLEVMALGEEPLRLYGVDPFAESNIRQLGVQTLNSEDSGFFARFLAEPGALVISAPLLERLDLTPGDSLSLAVGPWQRRAFVLAALPRSVGNVDVPDNLAIGDVATVQELARRDDVTRIDLILEEGFEAQLRDHLPPGVELRAPGGRTARLSSMLEALRINLRALSYLALFVSLFLIYNALVLAVLRRRPQVGIVRCLGATRGQVLGAWLVEALVIGTLGSALGCLVGAWGSQITLARLTQTASDLYGYVRADTVDLAPVTFLKAGLVGVLASLASAWIPAREAARTTPAHTSFRGDVELLEQKRRARAPWLSIPLLLVFALSLARDSDRAVWGYVAAVSLALTVGVLTPSVASYLLRVSQGAVGAVAGIVGQLASQNIREAMSRTGVALAALTVALSMSIAMGTMVSSFRTELTTWIDEVVKADIYVSPATAEVDRLNARLSPELEARLRARPAIAALDTYRGVEARIRGLETFMAGIDIETYRTRSRPHVLDGPDADEMLDRLRAGEVSISETLMRKHDLHAGDTIEIDAEGKQIRVKVAGVARDYSTDRGVIMSDRAHFERWFGPRDPNSIAVYVAEGTDVEAEVDALQRELGNTYALLIRSNRTLRDQAQTVFDRTFSVARALELIGIGVAAIGILAAMLAILVERGRELATLRALGLTTRQLQGMLTLESILMATLSWLFALFAGTGLAWILLNVINVRSFGWSLPLQISPSGWGLNLVWSLLAALLAILWPLWKSRRIPVAAALREE